MANGAPEAELDESERGVIVCFGVATQFGERLNQSAEIASGAGGVVAIRRALRRIERGLTKELLQRDVELRIGGVVRALGFT